MKATSIKIIFLYCLVFLSPQVSAENLSLNDWQQTKLIEKNNIKVGLYEHKNSEIKAFKVETHVTASLDSILSLMMASESCMEWVHGCQESMLIKRMSFNEQYHYQVIDVPFPFKDRDFIFHSVMIQDPVTKVVSIAITSVPDYCNNNQSELCEKINHSNLVRVKQSIGVYELRPDEQGTSISWIQHTNPSGNLPAWLVNQFVQDTPYWTMIKLAVEVQKSEYKHAKLVYNAQGLAVSLGDVQKEKNPIVSHFERFVSY